MLKKILLTIVLLLITAYLLVAITAFNRKPAGATCTDIELVIKDTAYAGFVTTKEIAAILTKKKLNPVGKNMDEIRTAELEEALATQPLIDRVECYKTPSHKICVEVTQRIPILHVINSRGENYYLDNKGTVMPSDAKCTALVPLATGFIDKTFAVSGLYPFGMYLQNDPFWEAQIEQIHVLPDRSIELVPRVGDHIIYLGKAEDYERKLSRVKKFYRKALNKVGWNKYGRINVEFSNQIICTHLYPNRLTDTL